MTKTNKKILVVSFQSLTEKSGAGMARLGYYLSKELDNINILKEFVVYSKGKYTTTFPSSPVSPWSRYILFILNKLNKIFHFPSHKFRYVQEVIFDWLCLHKIDNSTSILFVTQPYLYRTFRKAKKKGIQIVFVPANPEENYINDLVADEKKKMGIASIDAYTYAPRLRYFNKSIPYVDIVIGTYPTVYETYKNSNFAGKVVKINGHLKPDFKPTKIEDKKNVTGTFKVAYLAHSVVLKGLQYLMLAWQNLMQEKEADNMRLYIAGAFDKSVQDYINTHFSKLKNVELLGHVADVQEYMGDKDLFVVPSLVDGGPYTALEAAHCNLPVLITDNCGSAELLSRNESGCWIIPIKDADAIKEKIQWAYHHREECIKVGNNAKFNLENYDMPGFIKEVANYLEKMQNN